MNTITKDAQTHDFTTADELFAIARKTTGCDITHLYRNGRRVFGVDSRPVMCEAGVSREPVLFIGRLPRSGGLK